MRLLHASILEWVAMTPLRDLPKPGMEPRSPTLHVDSLLTEPPGKPFTLPRTVNMLHKIWEHSTQAVSLWVTAELGRSERKTNYGCSVFPFPSMVWFGGAPHASACSIIGETCCVYTVQEFCWTPAQGRPLEFCAPGAS